MKRLLTAIVRLALEIFFGELAVLGKDRVPAGGPVIVAANHPSSGMDALLLGAVFGARVHYLAKASLFRAPVAGRILRALGAIPVHRKQDSAGGDAPGARNVEAFDAAKGVLRHGGWLAIFPEGRSVAGMRLSPLKTGTARIALEAESESGFSLHLRILPVGLAYRSPATFRSEVAVAISKPIVVASYREAYEKDAAAAAHELTAAIDSGIRRELAYVPQDSLARLADAISAIYETDELAGQNPVAWREAKEEIRDALLYFAEHDPARVAAATRALERYGRKLARLQLSDRIVASRAGHRRVDRVRLFVSLATGAPVAIYGWLNHLVPYNVPRLAVRMLSPNPTDVSTVKLASGTLAFGSCYAAQIALAAHYGPGLAFTLGYAASLPISGIFALHYAHRMEVAKDEIGLLARLAGRKRGRALSQLAGERDSIYRELESARAERRAQLFASAR